MVASAQSPLCIRVALPGRHAAPFHRFCEIFFYAIATVVALTHPELRLCMTMLRCLAVPLGGLLLVFLGASAILVAECHLVLRLRIIVHFCRILIALECGCFVVVFAVALCLGQIILRILYGFRFFCFRAKVILPHALHKLPLFQRIGFVPELKTERRGSGIIVSHRAQLAAQLFRQTFPVCPGVRIRLKPFFDRLEKNYLRDLDIPPVHADALLILGKIHFHNKLIRFHRIPLLVVL